MAFIYLILILTFANISEGRPRIGRHFEEAGFFEGDINLGYQGLRNALIDTNMHWPNGTVPVEFDKTFSQAELEIINGAISEISSKTCVRFQPRTTEANYVYIDRGQFGSGCWSPAGMLGRGQQTVNLEPPLFGFIGGCIQHGIVAHEMIHALGFYHEQSRPDRDKYVTINWWNIPNDQKYNFKKYPSSDVTTYGIPYDYESLMHYESNTFAIIPWVDTIKAPHGIKIGQRDHLSSSDVKKIKIMYKCDSY